MALERQPALSRSQFNVGDRTIDGLGGDPGVESQESLALECVLGIRVGRRFLEHGLTLTSQPRHRKRFSAERANCGVVGRVRCEHARQR
jgi:hypothetical protein